jgi:hypothetical protein
VDDAGLADPTPARHVWTIDTQAPDTVIAVHPDALSQSPSATFGLSSNENPVEFECALDPLIDELVALPAESDWLACDATVQYQGLVDGVHVFWARARDAVGLVDATPARFEWLIDTQAPDTAIIDGPPAQLGAGQAAVFAYEDPADPGHDRFECSVDGGAWTACNGGVRTLAASSMAVGGHTFEVRTCVVGGPSGVSCDPSPAIWRWAVSASLCPEDLLAPVMTCQEDVALECVGGGAELDLATLAPTVSDACGEPDTAYVGGDPLVLGDNPVVFFASDDNGNTASCVTVVSVVDSEAPVLGCPEDIEV